MWAAFVCLEANTAFETKQREKCFINRFSYANLMYLGKFDIYGSCYSPIQNSNDRRRFALQMLSLSDGCCNNAGSICHSMARGWYLQPGCVFLQLDLAAHLAVKHSILWGNEN